MILRGDGTTGVHRADAFTWPEFPADHATVALSNPPFPHKKTDAPPEAFVERSLAGLKSGGRMAIIIPTSLLVKKEKKAWRDKLASKHTINGIISFEREIWQPYADSVTSILIMTKGIPHRKNRDVFFAKVKNDGFRLEKRVRMPVPGGQLPDVIRCYQKKSAVPGLCGWAVLGENWGPGLYVPAAKMTDDEVIEEVYYLTRSQSAAAVSFAHRLVEMMSSVDSGEIELRSVRPKRLNLPEKQTIGDYFEIVYGQKTLHDKRDLVPGPALVISSQGTNNGFYGFFAQDTLFEPPFVTVPSTGSIAQAHVQRWPCGVADDALILVPNEGVPLEYLYITAAVIRSERWRFNYGMKATPSRIKGYQLPISDNVVERARTLIDNAKRIIDLAIESAEDERDIRIARERLAEIKKPKRIVQGTALRERLAQLETDR